MEAGRTFRMSFTLSAGVCVASLFLPWGGVPWRFITRPPDTPYRMVSGFEATLGAYGLPLPNWMPAAIAVGLALWVWAGVGQARWMPVPITVGLLQTAAIMLHFVAPLGVWLAIGPHGHMVGGNGFVGSGLILTLFALTAMFGASLRHAKGVQSASAVTVR